MVAATAVVPAPQEPTPIEPEPGPLEPNVPGRPPDPVDVGEVDEGAAAFPASDPPSHWAGEEPE